MSFCTTRKRGVAENLLTTIRLNAHSGVEPDASVLPSTAIDGARLFRSTMRRCCSASIALRLCQFTKIATATCKTSPAESASSRVNSCEMSAACTNRRTESCNVRSPSNRDKTAAITSVHWTCKSSNCESDRLARFNSILSIRQTNGTAVVPGFL